MYDSRLSSVDDLEEEFGSIIVDEKHFQDLGSHHEIIPSPNSTSADDIHQMSTPTSRSNSPISSAVSYESGVDLPIKPRKLSLRSGSLRTLDTLPEQIEMNFGRHLARANSEMGRFNRSDEFHPPLQRSMSVNQSIPTGMVRRPSMLSLSPTEVLTRLRGSESSQREIRLEMESLTNTKETLEKQIQRQSKTLEDKTKSLATLETEVISFTRSEALLKNTLQSLEENNTDLKAKLTKKESEIMTLRSEFKAIQLSHKEEKEQQKSEFEMKISQLVGQSRQDKQLMNSLKSEQATFQQQKEDLEARIESLQTEKVTARKELRSLKSELEVANMKIETLERDIEQRQQQIDQERRRLETESSKAHVLEVQLQLLQETELRLQSDLSSIQTVLDEEKQRFEITLKVAQTELHDVRQQHENQLMTEKSHYEEQLQLLQTDIVRLQSVVDQMVEEEGIHKIQLQNQEIQLEHEIESHKTEIISYTSKIESLIDELTIKKEEIDKLNIVYKSIKNELQQKEENLNQVIQQKDGLNIQLTIAIEEKDTFKKELEQSIVNHKELLDSLQKELLLEKNKQNQRIDEYVENEKLLTIELLNYKEIVINLKEKCHVSNLALEEIKRQNNIIENDSNDKDKKLLENIHELKTSKLLINDLQIKVKNMENALEVQSTSSQRRILELENQVTLNTQDRSQLQCIMTTMEESFSRKYSSILNERNEFIRSLENQLEELQRELRVVKAEYKETLSRHSEEIKTLRESERSLTMESQQYKISLSEQNEMTSILQEQLDILRKEVVNARALQEESRLSSSVELLSVIESEKHFKLQCRHLSAIAADLKETNVSLEKQVASLQKEWRDSSSSREVSENDLSNLRESDKHLRAQCQHMKSVCQQQMETVRHYEKRVEDLEKVMSRNEKEFRRSALTSAAEVVRLREAEESQRNTVHNLNIQMTEQLRTANVLHEQKEELRKVLLQCKDDHDETYRELIRIRDDERILRQQYEHVMITSSDQTQAVRSLERQVEEMRCAVYKAETDLKLASLGNTGELVALRELEKQLRVQCQQYQSMSSEQTEKMRDMSRLADDLRRDLMQTKRELEESRLSSSVELLSVIESEKHFKLQCRHLSAIAADLKETNVSLEKQVASLQKEWRDSSSSREVSENDLSNLRESDKHLRSQCQHMKSVCQQLTQRVRSLEEESRVISSPHPIKRDNTPVTSSSAASSSSLLSLSHSRRQGRRSPEKSDGSDRHYVVSDVSTSSSVFVEPRNLQESLGYDSSDEVTNTLYLRPHRRSFGTVIL